MANTVDFLYTCAFNHYAETKHSLFIPLVCFMNLELQTYLLTKLCVIGFKFTVAVEILNKEVQTGKGYSKYCYIK